MYTKDLFSIGAYIYQVNIYALISYYRELKKNLNGMFEQNHIFFFIDH